MIKYVSSRLTFVGIVYTCEVEGNGKLIKSSTYGFGRQLALIKSVNAEKTIKFA